MESLLFAFDLAAILLLLLGYLNASKDRSENTWGLFSYKADKHQPSPNSKKGRP